ncbi:MULTISPECIES: hypothetical protein [unclassified Synechococcus]|jgi:hypothetical protein|uniref:hypothetical protein n=1 Tax=unclassified Synechococcus TaxID=2626047 RepID=UPI0013DE4ABA|nr:MULTISPECIES: hypothetical protein [unclassified Synechococcus]QNG28036.1 hypothetical protein H0O21_05720 [Synechococcus sp. HK01-R]
MSSPWPSSLPRPPLLTGLGALVTLSVIARPSALLTFALIALAGQWSEGRRQP